MIETINYQLVRHILHSIQQSKSELKIYLQGSCQKHPEGGSLVFRGSTQYFKMIKGGGLSNYQILRGVQANLKFLSKWGILQCFSRSKFSDIQGGVQTISGYFRGLQSLCQKSRGGQDFAADDRKNGGPPPPLGVFGSFLYKQEVMVNLPVWLGGSIKDVLLGSQFYQEIRRL